MTLLQLKPGRCPSCSAGRLRPWREVSGYSFLECRSCSLVSLDPRYLREPEQIYTSAYFEAGAHSGYTNYSADETIHRWNARRHLSRMEHLGVRPPGTLLDVGCAAGFFMSEASSRGWGVVGVDVSPWSREQVERRFGFESFGSIEEALDDQGGDVDVVTAFQVLEHIPGIRAALRSIHSALKPRGHLVVETWNRDSLIARFLGAHWPQLSPPSVVHLFDPRSLNRLLGDAGFLPAELVPMTKFLSAAWAAGLAGSKLRSRTLQTLATSGILRRIPLPYALGDLVWLATTKGAEPRTCGGDPDREPPGLQREPHIPGPAAVPPEHRRRPSGQARWRAGAGKSPRRIRAGVGSRRRPLRSMRNTGPG